LPPGARAGQAVAFDQAAANTQQESPREIGRVSSSTPGVFVTATLRCRARGHIDIVVTHGHIRDDPQSRTPRVSNSRSTFRQQADERILAPKRASRLRGEKAVPSYPNIRLQNSPAIGAVVPQTKHAWKIILAYSHRGLTREKQHRRVTYLSRAAGTAIRD